MEKFGKSQPVIRVEDSRFLKGEGRYVNDIVPEGALHAYFFRSSVAHAEITDLDMQEARAADGVHLVWSSDDLLAAGVDINLPATTLTNIDGTPAAAPDRPALAVGRVRFVGEAVAVVVAQTLEQARDAAELIGFEYDDLEVHVDPVPGGAPIHAQAPDNVAFDWDFGDAAVCEAAFAKATHHIKLQVGDNRIIVNSIEPRGCFAEWNGTRLHLAVNGQGVWAQKQDLSNALHLDPEQVRVTNPDVGGGFGMKGMGYPEYIVISALARALGRPVRWMSDRTEAMLTDNAGRDLTSLCELAFDADLRMTGYRVTTLCNLGAYNSQFGQPIQTQLFTKVLPGTYDVQATYLAVKGI
ncbi:MAG: xanthine dehydrogenase family protein molybdopterin-binding subunit, partial [Marinosulfonomonas sp.]|nr:xanthine dehydrogenase family protein molybdopterin-binding subunit [Marinosulfonomonas sp.]